MRALVRALVTQKLMRRKGCALQLIGITLSDHPMMRLSGQCKMVSKAKMIWSGMTLVGGPTGNTNGDIHK